MVMIRKRNCLNITVDAQNKTFHKVLPQKCEFGYLNQNHSHNSKIKKLTAHQGQKDTVRKKQNVVLLRNHLPRKRSCPVFVRNDLRIC